MPQLWVCSRQRSVQLDARMQSFMACPTHANTSSGPQRHSHSSAVHLECVDMKIYLSSLMDSHCTGHPTHSPLFATCSSHTPTDSPGATPTCSPRDPSCVVCESKRAGTAQSWLLTLRATHFPLTNCTSLRKTVRRNPRKLQPSC
jgi:hypothetical protein